jgi:hypothetical protein
MKSWVPFRASEQVTSIRPTTNVTDASPAHLFRYGAALTPSFLATANGSSVYFSINRGFTQFAQYTNTPWSRRPWELGVQRGRQGSGWVAPAGVSANITNDVGSEIVVLNAVGFNLATPEPSTFGLFAILALAARLAAEPSKPALVPDRTSPKHSRCSSTMVMVRM